MTAYDLRLTPTVAVQQSNSPSSFYYSYDTAGIHFVSLCNDAVCREKGIHEQLAWYGACVLDRMSHAMMVLDRTAAGVEGTVRVIQYHASRASTLLPFDAVNHAATLNTKGSKLI
jgi:hypothetical protein